MPQHEYDFKGGKIVSLTISQAGDVAFPHGDQPFVSMRLDKPEGWTPEEASCAVIDASRLLAIQMTMIGFARLLLTPSQLRERAATLTERYNQLLASLEKALLESQAPPAGPGQVNG